MKKLFFTAALLVAFGGVSKANTIEVDSAKKNCAAVAYLTANTFEEASGGCYSSSQYNSIYNAAFAACASN